MEEYVQLKLETYDEMRKTINEQSKKVIELSEDLKDEREEKERVINKANEITKKLHEYIMDQHLAQWKFSDYPYDELIDFEDWGFAISDKSKLFELGFTKEEMIDYVMQAFAKWEREQEDND